MRILIFTFAIITLGATCFGQVAIINDPDGWTNVRALPDATSEVIYQVKNN